jgi:hypothetical protein
MIDIATNHWTLWYCKSTTYPRGSESDAHCHNFLNFIYLDTRRLWFYVMYWCMLWHGKPLDAMIFLVVSMRYFKNWKPQVRLSVSLHIYIVYMGVWFWPNKYSPKVLMLFLNIERKQELYLNVQILIASGLNHLWVNV